MVLSYATGQEIYSPNTTDQFFYEKAGKDARIEHNQRFVSLADETDFWDDQRAYEQDLFTANLQAYQIYLRGKRAAYLRHQADCSQECVHGDYYNRQAAFYLQFNPKSENGFMTLTQLQGHRGWELTYRTSEKH